MLTKIHTGATHAHSSKYVMLLEEKIFLGLYLFSDLRFQGELGFHKRLLVISLN